jgi:hypothetical protein
MENMESTNSKSVGTRSGPRIRQNSKLVIDGHDLLGYFFTEDCQVNDLSSTGISFYLKNRPWIEDPLHITIYPAEARDSAHLFGRKLRGRVVRTGAIEDDRQFVAARFE